MATRAALLGCAIFFHPLIKPRRGCRSEFVTGQTGIVTHSLRTPHFSPGFVLCSSREICRGVLCWLPFRKEFIARFLETAEGGHVFWTLWRSLWIAWFVRISTVQLQAGVKYLLPTLISFLWTVLCDHTSQWSRTRCCATSLPAQQPRGIFHSGGLSPGTAGISKWEVKYNICKQAVCSISHRQGLRMPQVQPSCTPARKEPLHLMRNGAQGVSMQLEQQLHQRSSSLSLFFTFRGTVAADEGWKVTFHSVLANGSH